MDDAKVRKWLHDVNNRIGMILANAELLQLEQLSAKAQQRRKLIEEKSLELRQIIRDFGDLLFWLFLPNRGLRGQEKSHRQSSNTSNRQYRVEDKHAASDFLCKTGCENGPLVCITKPTHQVAVLQNTNGLRK